MAAVFDATEIIDDLKKEGVSPNQAKAFVDAIVRTLELKAPDTEKIAKDAVERDKELVAMQAQFKAFEEKRKEDAQQAATKGDLRELKAELKGDLRELDAKLSGEIALVRKDMEALGNKLIIRLTLAMVGVVGVAVTIAGLLLRASLLK